MNDAEVVALYGSMLFAEMHGRVPHSEREYKDWLASKPQIPDDFRLYNEEGHTYILNLLDDRAPGAPRLDYLRELGFVLGLHHAGKSWEECEVIIKKEPPEGLTTQPTT